MTAQFIVHDITDDVKYTFCNKYKIDADGRGVKQIADGRKEANHKYNEIVYDTKHKCALIHIYPNYKSGETLTQLLQSNI